MIRTRLQRIANEIDRQLYTLVVGVEGVESVTELRPIARDIQRARGKVRRHMHPKDVEATQ